MRNGNLKKLMISQRRYIVLILPMRNGNIEKLKYFVKNKNVLILPMRNGNSLKRDCLMAFIPVLILPMRNGNKVHRLFSSPSLERSYPTYEEWKRQLHTRYGTISSRVLILPMRNGNRKQAEGLGLDALVLILPMRNGNRISYLDLRCRRELVLILPMRNGNRLSWDSEGLRSKSSYPTYEEWKPFHSLRSVYPTIRVLILPMRNGNLGKNMLPPVYPPKFLSYL